MPNILQAAIDAYPCDDAATEADFIANSADEYTAEENQQRVAKIKQHWVRVFAGESDASELLAKFISRFNESSPFKMS